MRVSTLYKPPASLKDAERVPTIRVVLWSAMAVLLLVGVALFFLFGRGVTPLL